MKPALNGRSVKPHRYGIAHEADCLCPTCDQPISFEKFAEIQGKQRAHDAEIERSAEARFSSREAAIRQESVAAATAALAPKLAKAEEARKTAEQQVKTVRVTFDATLKQRLDAQAEAAAKAKVEAVNAVTEKFFGENLRLQERVQELQRMLEKKTANELGDAGEIDLLEALMAEFPADQIARVPKGVPGPDITLLVFNNGVFTGRSIIFDSKNHKAWQKQMDSQVACRSDCRRGRPRGARLDCFSRRPSAPDGQGRGGRLYPGSGCRGRPHPACGGPALPGAQAVQ
jgi:hypothetical protein